MSTELETTDHHGPTPSQYVQIFGVLFALTAMEIAASYIDVGGLFLPILLILMTIKFIMVAGWFMHLKYDTKTYTAFMVTGLLLAMALYSVLLLIFSDAIKV
ncbi:MAG: cytochrome c oxidase subunit 4 [Nitriliruptoraceae bacterium]|jgi:cytochrome c oxidase subunit 4